MLALLTNLNIPIALLAVHTLADFRLQSNWMAINKSKRLDALLLHVAIYTTTFIVFLALSGWTFDAIGWFACITFYTHLLTDYVTSRLSRRVYPLIPLTEKTNEGHTLYVDHEGTNGRSRNRFFNIIGVDQLIHFFTLALTYKWLIQ